jgi:D-arabinose 1-dehydrogenase-like Zn-dependent alcohol dehydrogenase
LKLSTGTTVCDLPILLSSIENDTKYPSAKIVKMALNFTKYLARQKGSSLEAMIAPKPLVLQPTEVLIRIKAVAVNPADYKMIDQGHRVASWPLVPGLDGAGVVEQVGDKAGDFRVGDRVLALFTPGDCSGSYQEYAVVQVKDVAKFPAKWSLEEAATLGSVEPPFPFAISRFHYSIAPSWSFGV